MLSSSAKGEKLKISVVTWNVSAWNVSDESFNLKLNDKHRELIKIID